MKMHLNLALGIGLAAGLGTTAADAAVKYVGTRNGPGPNSTSELNLAATDGAAGLDDDGVVNGEVLWSSAHVRVLQDVVMVTNGTLRIQEGTVVRGQPQSGAGVYDPGALVITRTAKLIAIGSPSQPIVFTTACVANTQYGAVAAPGSEAFWDLNPAHQPLYTLGDWDGNPATPDTWGKSSGRWGGLVLLGNAPTNVDRTPLRPADMTTGGDLTRARIRIAGEAGGSTPLPAGSWTADTDDRPSIEGVPDTSAAFLGGLDRYGGRDSAHSSGTLKCVSIKFGGAEIAAANELNGLTLGGIGSGTVIDQLEVFGNTDDGIEIFGGTAHLKRVVVAGTEDDQLDIDVGFQGTIQFALCLTGQDSDKMCEWDGSYEGESPNGFTAAQHGSGTPGPVNTARTTNNGYGIYNATFIGNLAATTTITADTSSGGQATGNNDRNHGIQIRDQSSPTLVNSVLANPRGYGLALGNRSPVTEDDVTNRFANGAARLSHVSFAKAGASSNPAMLTNWASNANTAVAASVVANGIGACAGNEAIDDALMLNLPASAGQQYLPAGLKINPVAFGVSPGTSVAGGALESCDYRGAFNPFDLAGSLWTKDWSVVSQLGIVVDTADEGYGE
jgi:hypothetical protein